MEYRKDGENEWHSITGDTVEGLSTGKYYVRYKDSKNYYASSEKEVYIANGQEIKVKVPASQVGYTLSVSNTVVDYNESSTLTFKLNKGYSKTKNFAVKVNGETFVFLITNVLDASEIISLETTINSDEHGYFANHTTFKRQ